MDGWARGLALKRLVIGLSVAVAFASVSLGEIRGQEDVTAGSGETKAAARRSGSTSQVKRGVKSAGANKSAGRSGGSPGSSGSSLATSDSATSGSESQGGRAAENDGTGDPFQSAIEGETPKSAVATFGAGCFWHVEAEFEWLPGVKSAVSGYSGGTLTNPTYEDVHEGWTGHAEVVRVEYDPSVISYEQLLKVFWSGHDPTQLNRQGPDFGTQYRSVIFYHSPEQKKAALKSYEDLTRARVFRGPIVTQLVQAPMFYPAEEYHQNYYGGKDGRAAMKRRSKGVRKPAVSGLKTDANKGPTIGSGKGKLTVSGSKAAANGSTRSAERSGGLVGAGNE